MGSPAMPPPEDQAQSAGPTPPPGGNPPGGPGAGPPGADQQGMQAPPDQTQVMMAKIYQACKQLAQLNPVLAPGLSKAAEGIQEAQSALVSQPRQQPPQQTPPQ